MEKEILEHSLQINRRRFLSRLSLGIGSVALGSLLIPDLFKGGSEEESAIVGLPHFAPRAKRIIYLFQNGAPSQLDLFDYKPLLQKMQGEDFLQMLRNLNKMQNVGEQITKINFLLEKISEKPQLLDSAVNFLQ